MTEFNTKKKDFAARLFKWYRANARDLPWRRTVDPYYIWISEIMLQQTTVQSVIPYFNRWIKTFPDIATLSKAPLQKVLKNWQGLGYYQRAKNLHAAAKIIVTKYGGQFPRKYEEMFQLPGFGPYTTAAVLSLAFDLPHPVLDANVRRVLVRLAGYEKKVSPSLDKTLLEFLSPFLPKKKMGTFNQALMELGALVCKPKNPACLLCPFPESCSAYKSGKQEVLPRPKKRSYRRITAVVGIIRRGDKFFIQKRPSAGLLADLWEFPGGKAKPGESLEEALCREIKEELDVEVQSATSLVTVRHAYTQFLVTLHAFECRLKEAPVLAKDTQRWASLKSIHRYPLPSGSAKIVHYLEDIQKNKENTDGKK